jgi:quercetin dioxygenase-like cupin family protein
MERKNFIKSIGFGFVGSLVGRQALAMNKNKIIKPTMKKIEPLINNRKDIATRTEQTAHETKGVTVKQLAALDLGPEIEGLAGRQLRMRIVTIEPGGVFGPIHDHKDRPGMVYILQGTITDHRNGLAKEYGPGAGWPEDKNTTHWLENRGTTVAVEISVDIFRQQ